MIAGKDDYDEHASCDVTIEQVNDLSSSFWSETEAKQEETKEETQRKKLIALIYQQDRCKEELEILSAEQTRIVLNLKSTARLIANGLSAIDARLGCDDLKIPQYAEYVKSVFGLEFDVSSESCKCISTSYSIHTPVSVHLSMSPETISALADRSLLIQKFVQVLKRLWLAQKFAVFHSIPRDSLMSSVDSDLSRALDPDDAGSEVYSETIADQEQDDALNALLEGFDV